MTTPSPFLQSLIDAAEGVTPGEWKVHENPRYWIRLPIEQEGDPNRDKNAAAIATVINALPEIIRRLREAERITSNEND